ncbi:hypothetical protein [Jeotgalibacillus proteolyticus]|uniref:Uncharacterized protein n=1 Tax=Jeotgalibacillus proteolyticus TaxID=2082395 RepID=A0A2S5GC46_9BACL|nr:hypothetical protein [Jeotgalibacillus proteolyticus]PPA70602.1 hypothetical protein C4B60_07315 [Jeotgalibacillus proteolyticus]
MDQLLRYISILAIIIFGAFELFFGLNYGEWSLKGLVGIGAALGLFLLTFQSSNEDHNHRHLRH